MTEIAFALARYNRDGSLDMTLNSTGWLVTSSFSLILRRTWRVPRLELGEAVSRVSLVNNVGGEFR